jgi:hypothetical protein
MFSSVKSVILVSYFSQVFLILCRYVESSITLAEVTKHFEQSLKHLTSLDNEIVLKLEESAQVRTDSKARQTFYT